MHGEGQFPLWDTMMDMIDAAFTTIISAIVMYAVLKLTEKHKEKQKVLQNNSQPVEITITE